MGSNRRYAAHFDRLASERIAETIARDSDATTLSPAELDLEHLPLTRTPIPRPVSAWVRFGDVPLLVDAEMTAWTPKAAAVKFVISGREHRVWVWGSAVTER